MADKIAKLFLGTLSPDTRILKSFSITEDTDGIFETITFFTVQPPTDI